jgi:alpha-N-arabinofuranosidase
MVCLGVRPRGYHSVHVLGRETFLAPVVWDADGWPVVGNAGRIELEMESDRLPAPQSAWRESAVRDDFDSPRLAVVWNYIRNPRRENYALDECPGWLTLRGSEQDLDNMKWPTFLGRRQCHWRCTATTLLDFAPEADGEEAGLTVFQNYDHHYEIAVARRDGRRRLIARRRIGRLWAVTADEPLADGPVRLRIACDEHFYRLMAAGPGEADSRSLATGRTETSLRPIAAETDFRMLDEGETRYLSTEVGGRFTGVYFGLYAHGSGRPAAAPARFDWFDYEPAE